LLRVQEISTLSEHSPQFVTPIVTFKYPYPIRDSGGMMKKRFNLEVEEYMDRYAESALISAIRLRRYWIKQGYSDDEAIARAVKQAAGMMTSSGVPLDRLITLFEELESASKAFKEMLLDVSKKVNIKKKT
jgi:hypothetical protein